MSPSDADADSDTLPTGDTASGSRAAILQRLSGALPADLVDRLRRR